MEEIWLENIIYPKGGEWWENFILGR